MGYTPKLRVLSLDFSDTEYPEIEIKALSATLREWHSLTPGVPMEDDEVVSLLVKKITHWNLVDEDDNPLPISIESFDTFDFELIRTIFVQYQLAIRGIPSELGKESTDGENPIVDSIPMETM